MATYFIPSVNMAELDRRIARLNARAEKLKLAPIVTKVFSVLPTEYTTDGRLKAHARYEVVIDGLAPKLPGWEFVGTLEHTEAGNIMRILPGQSVPESFRTVKPWCEHCRTKRMRKDTFLVRAENGELKQVARQCIRDFLGHVSPDHIAWLSTFVREMEELQEETCARKAPLTFTVSEIASCAAASIRQFGWVSRSAAQSYSEKSGGTASLNPTISRVWTELDPSPEARKKREKLEDKDRIEVLPQDEQLTADAIEWAKQLTPGPSDYLHNLKMIASKPMVEFMGRDGGLLASLIPAYQKEVLKQEQDRQRKVTLADIAAKSNFQGEVGKRQNWSLTLKRRIVIGQGFHSRHQDDNLYLYCFEDEAGNQFTWMTGKTGLDSFEMVGPEGNQWESCRVIPFEEGKRYQIKGTVKEHKVYKEIRQTVLTRCRVEKVL